MAQAPAVTARLDDLLARYADGDRGAFDPLFAAVWPVVVQFCRRYVDDAADAEDAAQRTMIKLAEQAHRYDRERPALGWIFALAVWECRTTRRRRQREGRRHAPLDALAEATRGRDDPEHELAQRELGAALHAAVGGLPELDRQTILDDLRGQLDPAVGAATRRKRRQRALDRLRSIWRVTHGS